MISFILEAEKSQKRFLPSIYSLVLLDSKTNRKFVKTVVEFRLEDAIEKATKDISKEGGAVANNLQPAQYDIKEFENLFDEVDEVEMQFVEGEDVESEEKQTFDFNIEQHERREKFDNMTRDEIKDYAEDVYDIQLNSWDNKDMLVQNLLEKVAEEEREDFMKELLTEDREDLLEEFQGVLKEHEYKYVKDQLGQPEDR